MQVFQGSFEFKKSDAADEAACKIMTVWIHVKKSKNE